MQPLHEEIKNDPVALYNAAIKVSKLIDSFAITTFIKGREEVILRQMDEIAEISTPAIRYGTAL